MRHLLISREFPPAPAGGIGTYAAHIARLLAEAGETVHVIGQRWAGADADREVRMDGRLVIHRVGFEDWNALLGARPHGMQSDIARSLFRTSLPAQAFAWEAALLAERIIEEESIDVIEAQEYEAPAYFLALRRTLGLGPAQRPPLIVHLHSPTDFISTHNEWDPATPGTMLASRLERTTLDMADALLCPSAYLARGAEARFGLDAGSITVIPLPYTGESGGARTAEAWRSGPVAFIGRLERRKGILEWLDAAVQVAARRPGVTFEFLGANVLGTARQSGETIVGRMVPKELRPRFIFHGHGARERVNDLLARARFAVVPSRWENFPYTCVEAMAAGLPVLASPEGGMIEMIEDGESGWISADATPGALAATLERALAAPPERLEAMGARAASDIRTLCDPASVVRAHLEFRKAVCSKGAHRSAPAIVTQARGRGIACVVMDGVDDAALERTVRSLAAQSVSPAAVIVGRTRDPGTEKAPGIPFDARLRAGWRYHDIMERRRSAARNRAAEFAARLVHDTTGEAPLGVAFIEPGVEIEREFLAGAQRALTVQERAGIVAGWTRDSAGVLHAPPQPSFPYQFLRNDVGPGAVVRSDAFQEVGGFDEQVADGLETWDLANRIMARGWRAVTLPILAVHDHAERTMPDLNGVTPQQTLLERLPDVVEKHARELAVLAAAAISRSSQDPPPWAPPSLRDVIGFAVRHPVQTTRRLRERIAMVRRMRAADRKSKAGRSGAP